MDDLKIFVCAHKLFKNRIPKDKEYVVLSQIHNLEVDGHEVIYIGDDEFTKTHNICYGEGCQMKWLWEHPYVLPKYVGMCHYRRFFDDLEGRLGDVPKLIEMCGAIVKTPHKLINQTNRQIMINRHLSEEAKALIKIVHECDNKKYVSAFDEMLDDTCYSICNLFIMKKEDFLEMCEIIFGILDMYDERQSLHCNEDVKEACFKQWMLGKTSNMPIRWLRRLQGFWIEWLTDTYYRYKYGKNKVYYVNANTIDGKYLLFNERNDNGYDVNKKISKLKRTVVYVCVGKKKYVDMMHFSIYTLKNFNECNVTILSDEYTIFNDYIEKNATIKRIKIDSDDNRYKSRWLKTQIPKFVDGKWIFIDCDTIILDGLAEVDKLNGLCIVEEGKTKTLLNSVSNRFSNYIHIEDFLGHTYYNSGVIVGDESSLSFFEKWHNNWVMYCAMTDKFFDQEPLFKTNVDSGDIINNLDPYYNFFVVREKWLPNNIKIMHYWSDTKINNNIIRNIVSKKSHTKDDIVTAIWAYPKRAYIQTIGNRNLFISPKKGYMFSAICKNGSSYIRYITVLNILGKEKIEKQNFYHKLCADNGLYYHPIGSDYIIHKNNKCTAKEFDPNDNKMVYIWRDPFERFVSLYNDKVIGKNGVWENYKKVGITNTTTFEEFLEFAKLNITSIDIHDVEEHIRPQMGYYTTKVDVIVKIEDLNKFIQENSISTDFSYINHFPHDIEKYEKYRNEVYKLYDMDMNILNKFKDKIYVPKE